MMTWGGVRVPPGGRKPYGPRTGEAEVIEIIQSLRDAGMAMDTIAETLNINRPQRPTSVK
jgi:DNA-binding transcriptional MerR regulator